MPEEGHSRTKALHFRRNPVLLPTCRLVAAWDILSTFAAERQRQSARLKNMRTDSGPGCKDIVSLGPAISSSICCSICGTEHLQQTTLFHCNVRDINDFDLCQECYDKGLHCFDSDRLLVDIEKNGVFKHCEEIPSQLSESRGSDDSRDLVFEI